MKVEEIRIGDVEYPESLRKIYDPPMKLFVLGNKKLLKQDNIAIVGSRKPTEYGEKVAFEFSKKISEKGINIVSGLALGIDKYAHLGALSKTIAVLGSGLDVIYPKENIDLAKNIINNGGCIITEYSLGTKPEKLHFPQRNRIISGLSKGVLVVEASEKSGALITADFALEQGKEVFAIPGNIFNKTSIGTNSLIKQGAQLVTCYEEIMDEI